MNTALNTRTRLPAEAEALEARFALRLTARLEAAAQDVPHDIGERLRVARLQALAQARIPAALQRPQAKEAGTISIILADPGSGTATLGHSGLPGEESVWWSRLGWLVPALALALGLVGLGEWEARERIAQAAQMDTELLGDDLPPAAYLDAGFGEFLRQPPEVAPVLVEMPAVEAVPDTTSPTGN